MEWRKVEEPGSGVSANLKESPKSKSPNKNLIVFDRLFTRWIEVKPVPNATGITVHLKTWLFFDGVADWLSIMEVSSTIGG